MEDYKAKILADHQKKIEQLKAELARQQDIADEARKKISQAIRDLAKEEISIVVPSELVKEASRKMGPMDDVFFNRMGEDEDAIGEVISTVLGIPVVVKDAVPQYAIAGIGNRGVRLDAFVSVVPEVVVAVELGEDCYLGEKGAVIDIEVQKDDNDDHEYRVYYNGASIVVRNTPRGTKKFADIQRAVVIFISDFDVFGEGEMYYEVGKFTKKSMTPRRSPVTEIYINTVNEDRSDERMGRIADLMKVFKNPELYDFDKFPKFSQRKKELKETEKGVMEVSSEIQQIIDNEKAEAKRKERKDMAGLMNYLLKNGRGEDAIKASEDESFLARLLAEFRSGMMVAK
ncbi:MAG: hypothetical protein IJ679_05165 [Lachnospiraceae bacterium]|nr:hypothetical protein [Lachnospiraceae bacterium]